MFEIPDYDRRYWAIARCALARQVSFLCTLNPSTLKRLATPGGLYRYHVNDVVEVTGFYHRSPVIVFLRKGRDMSNLTREKLHVNYVLAAIAALQRQFHQPLDPYRLVANTQAMRYELHWETSDIPARIGFNTCCQPWMRPWPVERALPPLHETRLGRGDPALGHRPGPAGGAV